MAEEEKKPEESEGIVGGILRSLGLGGLVDLALRFSTFQQRFREVNELVGERLSKGVTSEAARPHFSIRPHVEGNFTVRYIRGESGREWRPAGRRIIRRPVQRVVAGEPKEVEPLADVFDEGEHLRVVAELPGVREDDIKVEVKGGELTISADAPGRRYLRKVPLPAAVKSEPAKLAYKNHVLEIELEKER